MKRAKETALLCLLAAFLGHALSVFRGGPFLGLLVEDAGVVRVQSSTDKIEEADPSSTNLLRGSGGEDVGGAQRQERRLDSVPTEGGSPSDAVAPIDPPPTVPDASVYDPVIVGRLDFWGTASPAPVLMLVTHREMFAGCNSFDEYLSPDFHTLLVFPKDFALHMKLDELVRSATPSKSAGVHLFYTDGHAGSVRARKIAIDFIEREIDPLQASAEKEKMEFVQSLDCNVHEIPEGYFQYHHGTAMSTRNATLRMVRDFQILKRGEVVPTNYDSDGYPALEHGEECPHRDCFKDELRGIHDVPNAGYGTLAMNTILFEDKHGKIFHGRDVTEWGPRKKGGKKNWAARASTLLKKDDPWFHDVSQYFEAHGYMFDIAAMKTIYDEYFHVAYPNFPSETVFIGELANRHKLRIVRNNDVSLNVDLGQSKVEWPPHVDLEWIKSQSMKLFCDYRNPKTQFETWNRAAEVGIQAPVTGVAFISIVQMQCRWENWFPANWTETSRVREVYQPLALIFRFYGYEPIESRTSDDGGEIYRFKLAGKYGANRIFYQTSTGKDKDGSEIPLPAPDLYRGPTLSFQVGDTKYYHESVYSGWERTAPEDLDRVIEVPADGILPKSQIYECAREFEEFFDDVAPGTAAS